MHSVVYVVQYTTISACMTTENIVVNNHDHRQLIVH